MTEEFLVLLGFYWLHRVSCGVFNGSDLILLGFTGFCQQGQERDFVDDTFSLVDRFPPTGGVVFIIIIIFYWIFTEFYCAALFR